MLGLGSSLISGDYNEKPFANTYSVAFDGTGDYIDLNTTASAVFQSTLQGSFTISFWMKPDDGQPSGNESLFGSNLSSTDWILWQHKTDGKMQFYFESNNDIGNTVTDAAVYANGAGGWKLMTVTATLNTSGNTGFIIYVNDAAVASTTSSDVDDTNHALFTTDKNLYVGAYNNNGSVGGEYAGNIDDFAVWNTVLDAAAVAAIYNSGTPIDLTANNGNYDEYTDNLVGYWTMEDGTGTNVTDIVGSIDGTFAGNPAWDTDTPDD